MDSRFPRAIFRSSSAYLTFLCCFSCCLWKVIWHFVVNYHDSEQGIFILQRLWRAVAVQLLWGVPHSSRAFCFGISAWAAPQEWPLLLSSFCGGSVASTPPFQENSAKFALHSSLSCSAFLIKTFYEAVLLSCLVHPEIQRNYQCTWIWI